MTTFSRREIIIFLRRVWPIGFLTVLAVCYFGDIRGSLFIERDLLVFFIPPRQFWIEEVKNFIFPLWNPYYHNGHPLFATLQPGVLYPTSVLHLFLPFNWAFNLNIELHFALAGIFTYLLVRAMRASQGAAIISAIGFMLSGYLISVHSLLSTLLSVTWVPLFFLCYFSSIKNNRLDHALLSGVIGTIMFLGGGVEVCYLTFGVAFFLTLFPELVLGLDNFIKIRRRLVFFAIFCAVFFGLSSVQLIPFLELSQLSIRSGGLPYKEAATWSLHLYDLVEFFVPDMYGLATDIKKYWLFQNWLKTIYMGGIPFILAVFFLRKWDRRAQGFLLLFLISLVLAMGNNTFFYPVLYDYLPLFNKLRFPVKFIFLAVLVLSVAAGLGYDYFKKTLAERSPESQRWAQYILTLGFFFMLVFGAFSIFNEPIVASLKASGWDHPAYNEIELNLFNFKRFLVFSSLFCLGLFLYSQPKFKRPVILVGVITIFALDLFFAHFNFYQREEFTKIQKTGENPKFILSDPELLRIFVTPKTRKTENEIKENWKGLDIRKEKLFTGLLGNQRILDVNGVAVTRQERWRKVVDLITSAPAIDSTNLLNMMNVKYVVSLPPITSPDFELVYSYEPIPQDPQERAEFEESDVTKIYENKKMLPHAFLVSRCKVASSDDEYKKTLESKSFNPEQLVLLDAEPKGFPCDEKKAPEKLEPVRVDSYESNTVELSVNSRERSLLFLSDSYYPGWKAYVDGEEVEILRANYVFRAVVIEQGEHRVRFEYDPLSFKLGLAITLLTILICGVTLFKYKIEENV
ncbi:MAG: YfhO family protein [Nitrospina sp.]|nr:YfhO family protein [Nitrospina sp.]MBT3414604.1 YfhO family protein [Nitrospina sp.]MBT3855395.1 YfhO family protein [Nitrospina sp.]MBT4106059.1 YfhO family protein [Nitrospina sp.]MBT4388471.1 YfhO family protein [Nitrospina sp.]